MPLRPAQEHIVLFQRLLAEEDDRPQTQALQEGQVPRGGYGPPVERLAGSGRAGRGGIVRGR